MKDWKRPPEALHVIVATLTGLEGTTQRSFLIVKSFIKVASLETLLNRSCRQSLWLSIADLDVGVAE